MLNFNSILLFSEDPKKLVAFYKKVFQKDPEGLGGEYKGWKTETGLFMIGPHDKVKGKNSSPERMLVNFQTTDVEKDFERIEKLGTQVITKPYHPDDEAKMTIATFADPDNNYFQLASPMP